MPPTVRDAYMAEVRRSRASDDPEATWRALERAHILSQPWPVAHVGAHWRMLVAAARQRDRHEAIGQLVRLAVAGPGSLSGRYPEGNTGRASVGLRDPMPIPDDLAALLAGAESPSDPEHGH